MNQPPEQIPVHQVALTSISATDMASPQATPVLFSAVGVWADLSPLRAIGATAPADSRDIVINAPDVAENGAVVPISIRSNLPDTETTGAAK